MKKISMLLFLALFLLSCQPEEDEFTDLNLTVRTEIQDSKVKNEANRIRVRNIEALRKLPFPNTKNRKEVLVLGYYEPDDGGGGNFYWDPISTEEDNGGTIISIQNNETGRWKRDYKDTINVKWFGARGDNLKDYGWAFENFSNVINGNGNVVAIIPKDKDFYLSSKQIYINRDNIFIQILGDLKNIGISPSSFIKIGDKNGSLINNIKIIGNDVRIDHNGQIIQDYVLGKGEGPSTCEVNNVQNLYISGIWFKNGLVENLKLYKCRSVIVEKCKASNSKYNNGFTVNFNAKSSLESDSSNIIIRNCVSFDNMDFGFTSFGASNVIFENCYSFNNGNFDINQINSGGGFSMEDTPSHPNKNDFNVKFLNCHSSGNKHSGFFITGNSVEIDSKSSAIGTIAKKGDLNNFSGNGVLILNAKSIIINGKFSDNDNSGIFVFGNKAGIFPEVKINAECRNNGHNGLSGKGVERISIMGGSFEDNFHNGIDINNFGTSYNQKNGKFLANSTSTSGNGIHGIWIHNLDSLEMYNNYIKDFNGNGIRIENVNMAKIIDNEASVEKNSVFKVILNIFPNVKRTFCWDNDFADLIIVNNAITKEEKP